MTTTAAYTAPDKDSVEERALSAILHQRRHVLLHGPGGVGKSYFITNTVLPANAARKRPFTIALTAPTGISASLLGGVTIHSWAGLGLGMSNNDNSRRPDQKRPTIGEMAEQLAKRLFGKTEKLQEIRDTDILLLDEISMVGDELFDLLDQVLRLVRRNVYEPFGGLQLILLGDVMQLPPVKAKFFFRSQAWVDLCGGTDPNAPSLIDFFVFNQCRRFTNMEWFHLLARVRMGEITTRDKEVLRKRMITVSKEEELKDLPFVTGRIHSVDNENLYRLNLLAGPDYICRAQDYLKDNQGFSLPKTVREMLSKHFAPTTPESFTLRVGARVMLRKNLDFANFYVNGSTGTVVVVDAVKEHPGKKLTPPGLTVRRVLVQFDQLTPHLQKIIDEKRADTVQRITAQVSKLQVASKRVVGGPGSNTKTSSNTKDGNDADDEDDDEGEPGVDEEKSAPVSTPEPHEEDRSQRRIWITPVENEVPFNKQVLGIRRTTMASFTMNQQFVDRTQPDAVLDVPETGDEEEDGKMRQLASSRGATVKLCRLQVPLVLAWSLTVHKVRSLW